MRISELNISDVGGLKPNANTLNAQAQIAAPGPTFEQSIQQVAGDAIGAMREGEAAAIQGIQGSLTPYKVVESVMNAQRTLQTVLAIRDKAVSAYQEITRMPI